MLFEEFKHVPLAEEMKCTVEGSLDASGCSYVVVCDYRVWFLKVVEFFKLEKEPFISLRSFTLDKSES